VEALEPSGVQLAARELVERLRLRDGLDGRPRVVAAMIASADGRATIDGKSGPLGHPEDRDLLRELRAGADAVLVGSNTLTTERYANLLDPDQVAWRRAAGLSDNPLLATIDRHGALRAADVPLFAEPTAAIRVYREAAGAPFDDAAAAVRIAPLGAGGVAFAAVLADLYERDDVRGVTCEGGPRLLRELIAQGHLDDLLITVSPLLAAGAGPSIVTGEALSPPVGLQLVDVHRAENHLFLHYVPAG
jgi:riboflavin biosynthesis pyrimidine reductase